MIVKDSGREIRGKKRRKNPHISRRAFTKTCVMTSRRSRLISQSLREKKREGKRRKDHGKNLAGKVRQFTFSSCEGLIHTGKNFLSEIRVFLTGCHPLLGKD